MTTEHADWRCRIGRHHYAVVQDDNPEMRGGSHLECTRCGHLKDTPSYSPPPPGGLAGSMGPGKNET